MTNGYPSAARAPSMSVKRRSSNNRGRYVHVTVGIPPFPPSDVSRHSGLVSPYVSRHRRPADLWYPLVTGFCFVALRGGGTKSHLRGTCSRLSCNWEAEAVFQWRGDLAGSNRLRAPAARHNSPIITAPAESGVK